ncbi:MAG: class I SAM-dependent methyltransferase [Gloeobacteraceae cyanobacterium ES-bin-144]|nr:class I SAM-dependent methyltransferase [Verrucomicrobiales bacterium]
MFQKITSTDFNRYPGIFRTVSAVMKAQHGIELNGSRMRILSFGCSAGHEMQSIRCYFPDAQIFGCDVNKEVLYKAKKALSSDRLAHVFVSNEENIVANGPYDIIFAMSVFCQYPESKKLANIENLFPFSRFQKLAGLLCDNLISEGIFCLMNSNYLFRHSSMSSRFIPIRSPLQAGNGFIDKFDQSGARLTTSFGSKSMYSHRREAADINDADLIDCMYQHVSDSHRDRSTIPFSVSDGPLGFKSLGEEIQLAGECLDQAIKEKRAAMSLFGDFGVDSHGGWWVKNIWRRSTLDSSLMEMEPFWHRVEENHVLKRSRLAQQNESLDEYISTSKTLTRGLREKMLGLLGLKKHMK